MIPWRKKWLPTPVFLPGEFYGQRSLVGYNPWGCKESNMTERLTVSLLYCNLQGSGQSSVPYTSVQHTVYTHLFSLLIMLSHPQTQPPTTWNLPTRIQLAIQITVPLHKLSILLGMLPPYIFCSTNPQLKCLLFWDTFLTHLETLNQIPFIFSHSALRSDLYYWT